MKPFWILLLIAFPTAAQIPCSRPEYRQFDFWLGKWEVFSTNGVKAGDSEVSLILDSCVLLEEWTSASINRGLRYAGKSFNSFNATTKQWQQTWVDNTGGSNEYLSGVATGKSIIFKTTAFRFSGDTLAIRRLSFYQLSADRVRQHGEISKDNQITWTTEYDLEYRRKK